MKRNFFILPGLILVSIFTFVFIACSNEEQSSISNNILESKEILKKYANVHNSGLDYIKRDAQSTQNKFTQKYLDEVLEKFVISIYGKDDAHKIMQETAPMVKKVFNGDIPSLTRTRSSISTNTAIEASNECLDKIRTHLYTFKDNEIFDNKLLLEDLHLIISQTYDKYVQKCNSDIEKQTLAQALGVLYGSIEYWTNSKNVESWSKFEMDENEDLSSEQIAISKKATKKDDNKKDKEKKDDTKVSKVEYITVVAAADTAGSFLGAAIASGPAAVAASAAAALYFDVE